MASVRDLHRRAMDLAQDAATARYAGEADRARRLSGQALVLEREAAGMVERTPASEPTRSILYRSAATLAVWAGDPAEAIRLAKEGLAGSPSPRTAAELRRIVREAGG